MRLGGSRGLVCLSCAHLGSPEASLLVGKQGKDKISSGLVSTYEEVGISGSELESLQESVQRMFLSERTLLSKRTVLPDSSVLSKNLHTMLELHLYKYLKFLISKRKRSFFQGKKETKENAVFLRKI